MKWIDNILNKITMYRLVMYELIGLLLAALILGFFGVLPYAPLYLVFSVVYIFAVCWIVNKIFAWAYEASSNHESVYITAFILALIITPAVAFTDPAFLMLAFWASAIAMASKYILAIGKKHIFNPAAIAVVVTAFAINAGASWWVGTATMLPFVLIGGFLVVRKIQRFDLVLSAIFAGVISIFAFSLIHGSVTLSLFSNIFLYSPIIFFATVMLTEPLTTPPTGALRVPYGILSGVLLAPAIHVGVVYSTPELALAVGNVFSYLVSPKKKLMLSLKNVEQISIDSYDFIFIPDQQMSYRPGQYMEWTLAHKKSDTRGIRRCFTLASSPTERELRLGVKFYPDGSTFKKKLLSMEKGDTIVATGLAGDFVLPKDKNEKLVFIAGGIGITPFRSMVKSMIDKGDKHTVTLFYANKTADDVAYKELFDLAEEELGMKTIHALTDQGTDISSIPNAVRTIDAQTIAEHVPDYKDRTFYLSGPRGMVTSFKELLQSMGVQGSRIKTDFFPGFA